ncbi:MAG: galactose-1-phosphate uridylyltransferase, partial [Candidatus Margulisiibacteriota bacterium]
PWNIKVELEAARTHFLRKERCLFCDVIKQEFMTRERMVAENSDYVSFTPFASRFPFEVTIAPKKHACRFSDMSDESFGHLAFILKDVLTRLKVTLNDPAYNIILHTAPNIVGRPGMADYWTSIELDYHWHLQIMPRLTKVAGFEWGTGFYINPTPPEEAAEFLRDYEKYMVL